MTDKCLDCGAELTQATLRVKTYAFVCHLHGQESRVQVMLTCVNCDYLISKSPLLQIMYGNALRERVN